MNLSQHLVTLEQHIKMDETKIIVQECKAGDKPEDGTAGFSQINVRKEMGFSLPIFAPAAIAAAGARDVNLGILSLAGNRQVSFR